MKINLSNFINSKRMARNTIDYMPAHSGYTYQSEGAQRVLLINFANGTLVDMTFEQAQKLKVPTDQLIEGRTGAIEPLISYLINGGYARLPLEQAEKINL